MHAAVLLPTPQPPTPAADPNASLIRPFAILAAIAFVVGFVGYLAVAGTDMATLQARLLTPASPQVSNTAAPQPASDAWNLPKKI